jgi:hypothetical protein
MSAKQLRSERLATGVAGIAAAFTALSRTASPRVSLVGQISRPDPFQDSSYYFPDDLKTIDHWIEFQAVETKGQGSDAFGKLADSKVFQDFATKNELNAFIGQGVQGLANIGNQVNLATIRLPMPSSLTTDYNPQYSTPDLGAAAGAILKPFDQKIYNNSSLPSLLGGAGGDGISGAALESGGRGGAAAATNALGTAVNGIGGAGTFEAALKVGLGVAQNPHKIVLFTGVDFREHRFSWKLSPRSREESNMIKMIIDAFTYYAHPEYVGGGLFFKYPEFFNIKFRHPNYLFELQPSVCTDIQVNYHGQGVAAYIRDANGGGAPAPVEVELTLSFKETEIVTKNSLNKTLGRPSAPPADMSAVYNDPEIAERLRAAPDEAAGLVRNSTAQWNASNPGKTPDPALDIPNSATN